MFDGWILSDINTNYIWLMFGTNNTDDYYPFFVFDYTPDKNKTEFETIDINYIPFKKRHPELLLKYPAWFDGNRLDFN